MFLSLVESYIPNGSAKTIMKRAEVVTNGIVGSIERLIFKTPLPINTPTVYGLLDGPKLENVAGRRGKLSKFLIKLGEVLGND